ncbi:dehydrogenase/reductase SDR family member 4-like isoform X3 [Trachypithecus francoisi]|uniref:dehydrogenase/reductase SDR family member 4-like isoform X3 n=1 Tax=Trachypithecus francoisi TaxID=54180 RepID=UPI00141B8448|nr:dehydrogenase/reductase SDR family member 4-like isoform X3 [Trachypithecus francoisi]
MHKTGLLGLCVPAWNSVRMASSGMSRRDPLANKVALVTASTDGIGFAIARRLAQDGAHVVVSSRKQQNVDQAVSTLQGEGLSVTGTVCHVGKAEDRERLVATAVKLHGGIDILVSNAAVNPFFGSLMDITEEVWDKGFTPYNVSKTALLGLTKNLAIELAPRNIRVNCLAPGLIKTSFSRMLWMDKEKQERMKETLQIRRLGESEDYAGIVSFLCSEDASYITEETVVVGGGTPSHL